MILIISFSIPIYWAISNIFFETVTLLDPHVVTPQPIVAGEEIRVEYIIIRHKACTLVVRSMLERTAGTFKGRQYLLGQRQITFESSPIPFVTGFTAIVPEQLPEDPTLDEANYDTFNEARYYCNGLDFVIPRYLTTKGQNETPRIHVLIKRRS